MLMTLFFFAKHAAQLQKALGGLNLYYNKWALKFNLDKTKGIFFPEEKSENTNNFNLETTLLR